jgi:hypothetical protein
VCGASFCGESVGLLRGSSVVACPPACETASKCDSGSEAVCERHASARQNREDHAGCTPFPDAKTNGLLCKRITVHKQTASRCCVICELRFCALTYFAGRDIQATVAGGGDA